MTDETVTFWITGPAETREAVLEHIKQYGFYETTEDDPEDT
jgi:hypothetical protein